MTGKASEAKPNNLTNSYEPTPYERAAMVAYVARKKEKPLDPRIKVSEKDGVTQIAPDHPDPAVGHMLLMGALGTIDTDFLDGLLRQLANAGTQGRTVDEGGLNFMLAVVKGIEPKDQVEAMLAAQSRDLAKWRECAEMRWKARVQRRFHQSRGLILFRARRGRRLSYAPLPDVDPVLAPVEIPPALRQYGGNSLRYLAPSL